MMLAGCSAGTNNEPGEPGEITITNCGKDITFPQPAERIYLNESQLLTIMLELNADDDIVAVSGLNSGRREAIKRLYSDQRINDLPLDSEDYPTLENVVADTPDAMLAGKGWGYSEERNLTPHTLEQYNIPAYTVTLTCPERSADTPDDLSPWDAVLADIENVGAITGRKDKADTISEELSNRIRRLKSAPRDDNKPTVFHVGYFGTNFYSGAANSPAHAIIESAGGRNVLGDIDKRSVTGVAWETIAANDPDVLLIGDRGEGEQSSFEKKVQALREHPATSDMTAVQKSRFVRVPYPMLLSTPLAVDASEHLRNALEEWDLLPDSDIQPEIELPR